MFEIQPYIVYIKSDAQNRIDAVDSSAFLRDTDGWVEIDRGFDTRHHHAQGNYFEKPLYDDRGIHRYKTVLATDVASSEIMPIVQYEWEDDLWEVYERTQEEMDADYIPPVPHPDPTERIAALEAAMTAIEEGIASV